MTLPKSGDVVTAGCDLGFRSDSSALVIVHTRASIRYVAEILELRPQKGVPLKPSEVCNKFAERMKVHGASHVLADAHYRETLDEYLNASGLVYVPAPNRPADTYVRARTLFRQGVVRLPDHQRLLQQIREVTGRPLAGGGIAIVQQRWRTGGHGDLLSAMVLALYATGGDEIPHPNTTSWEDLEREKRRKACKEASADGLPWWKARGSRAPTRR